MVAKSVARWEPVVVAELKKQGVPLPSSLILAVINVESRGKPGLINPKSGASGLMQVMPTTLQDFNSRHGKTYTMGDMQSKSDMSARKQIEVGIAVLAHYWKRAYKYLKNRLPEVPVDELAHIADLFYAAGPGATMKRLDKLTVPTWESVKAAFPNWAAIPHPTKIFQTEHPWNVSTIGKWIEGPLKKIIKDPRTGFALGIIVLMLAYWIMKGKKR